MNENEKSNVNYVKILNCLFVYCIVFVFVCVCMRWWMRDRNAFFFSFLHLKMSTCKYRMMCGYIGTVYEYYNLIAYTFLSRRNTNILMGRFKIRRRWKSLLIFCFLLFARSSPSLALRFGSAVLPTTQSRFRGVFVIVESLHVVCVCVWFTPSSYKVFS